MNVFTVFLFFSLAVMGSAFGEEIRATFALLPLKTQLKLREEILIPVGEELRRIGVKLSEKSALVCDFQRFDGVLEADLLIKRGTTLRIESALRNQLSFREVLKYEETAVFNLVKIYWIPEVKVRFGIAPFAKDYAVSLGQELLESYKEDYIRGTRQGGVQFPVPTIQYASYRTTVKDEAEHTERLDLICWIDFGIFSYTYYTPTSTTFLSLRQERFPSREEMNAQFEVTVP